MKRADIVEGARYAVNTFRTEHPWRGTQREVLCADVEPRDTWEDRKVHIYVVPQQVRRNDGRNGMTDIKGFSVQVSPNAVLRLWSEEQAERDRKKSEDEAQREQWRREWEAEKQERKAALREWVYPFEGLMVNNDDDMNSGMPRTMWDKRHEDVDLAHFLTEFWGEQESTTLTIREPFLQKIAARIAAYESALRELSDVSDWSAVPMRKKYGLPE